MKGQLVGAVNQFFTALNKWHQDLQKAHNIENGVKIDRTFDEFLCAK